MADTIGLEPRRGIFEATTLLLEDLIRDYDSEFSGGIAPDSRLVADLGLDSLSIVMLTVAIEGRFKQRGLPFEHLLIRDGNYVEDLTVGELVGFLESHLVSPGGPDEEASRCRAQC